MNRPTVISTSTLTQMQEERQALNRAFLLLNGPEQLLSEISELCSSIAEELQRNEAPAEVVQRFRSAAPAQHDPRCSGTDLGRALVGCSEPAIADNEHASVVTHGTACVRCGGCEWVCAEAVWKYQQDVQHAMAEQRAELARARAVTGPPCPLCCHYLKAEHRTSWNPVAKDIRYYRNRDICTPPHECEIWRRDLLINHPAIAEELGLTPKEQG